VATPVQRRTTSIAPPSRRCSTLVRRRSERRRIARTRCDQRRSTSRQLEQFTLRFRGSASQPLADGIYALRSERGDTYSLFLQNAGFEARMPSTVAFSLVRPLSVASCGRA
jgi:hypothetical protein